jgi:hypothetical protein
MWFWGVRKGFGLFCFVLHHCVDYTKHNKRDLSHRFYLWRVTRIVNVKPHAIGKYNVEEDVNAN